MAENNAMKRGGGTITPSAAAAALARKSDLEHKHQVSDVLGLDHNVIAAELDRDVATVTLMAEAVMKDWKVVSSGAYRYVNTAYKSAEWDAKPTWADVDEAGNVVLTDSGIYEMSWSMDVSVPDEFTAVGSSTSPGNVVVDGSIGVNYRPGILTEYEDIGNVRYYKQWYQSAYKTGSKDAALLIKGSVLEQFGTVTVQTSGATVSPDTAKVVTIKAVTIRRIH